jgi:hypothetical protein
MDFVGESCNSERGDLILSPLGARCPYWSLVSELLRDENATTIAAAFLPHKEYKRHSLPTVPAESWPICSSPTRSSDLLKWMSDPDEIALRVKGTPLAALIDPTAPAQRAVVISSQPIWLPTAWSCYLNIAVAVATRSLRPSGKSSASVGYF